MNVYFEEENGGIYRSAENVVPISNHKEITTIHESFELNKMKKIIENIGGKIVSEGYHV